MLIANYFLAMLLWTRGDVRPCPGSPFYIS